VDEDATLSTDDEVEATTHPYAKALGVRLRTVRRQMGRSLLEVEALSGGAFKASVVGAYERGERIISVPRLHQLAKFYDLPVAQLLPPQEGGSGPMRPSQGQEKVSIDLAKIRETDGPERVHLRRFLSMIQAQRQDFNGRMITIRDADVRVIACLFGSTPDAMKRRLAELEVLVVS